MNITKTNTEAIFPSIESKINRFSTFVLQIIFFGIVFSFFCLFVLGPIYGIYKRGLEDILVTALICWSISLLVLIPVIRHYIIRRKNITNKIVVDSSGLLFYNLKNEIVRQILYTELQHSKQNFDIYTVTPVGSSMIPLLEVTMQQEKKSLETQRIDINLPLHVVKNKFTLHAHFMHGISIFRPDLKIDPMALRSFSIDPETWKVHKRKGISSGGWVLILTALIISGIIIGIPFLLSK